MPVLSADDLLALLSSTASPRSSTSPEADLPLRAAAPSSMDEEALPAELELLSSSSSSPSSSPSSRSPSSLPKASSVWTSVLRDTDAPAQLAIALAGGLFTRRTLRALCHHLGATLRGIAVLQGEAGAMGERLEEIEEEEEEQEQRLLPPLLNEAFDFGIVLLNASESAATLRAIAERAEPPLLQLQYPMMAEGDSTSCLAAGTCLPLGGQSIWGLLEPRLSGTLTPPLATKPVVLLSATLDAAAFFHADTPGADAAVSSTVALLAAVEAVVNLASGTGGTVDAAAVFSGLPRTPAFAFFTGEAWGQIGSRRFFHDVRTFNCSEPASMREPVSSGPPSASPTPFPAGMSEQSAPLPPIASCTDPFKADLRFEALRQAGVVSMLEIGPVGAIQAMGRHGEVALFLHSPDNAQRPTGSLLDCEGHLDWRAGTSVDGAALEGRDATMSVAHAIRLAAASTPGLTIGDAAEPGLPPGAALSLLNSASHPDDAPTPTRCDNHGAARDGSVATAVPDVAMLSDYNSRIPEGARHGTRFDTADGIDAEVICRAATAAAKAWWALAGGPQDALPTANCTLVQEMLDCLLVLPEPATRPTRIAGAEGDSASAHGHEGSTRSDDRCRIVRALEATSGSANAPLQPDRRSRYTGVFFPLQGEGGASDTARFTAAVLRDLLQPSCGLPSALKQADAMGTRADGEEQRSAASCEPTVIAHDALSPLLEYDAAAASWVVDDVVQERSEKNETGSYRGDPLWTESNWPPGVHATIWPFAPSQREPVFLLLFSLCTAIVTLAAVAADMMLRGWQRELNRMNE